MSDDKDTDFLDHGGDEFRPDEDFNIPEDPHSGFLDTEDDEFELTTEDVVDESGSEDFSGEINLDEFDETEELTGDPERDLEYEYEEEYEEGEEPPGDVSLGWKAWTGLALAAVLVAGGMFYAATSFMGGGQTQTQASQSLPEPPPAPPPAPEENRQALPEPPPAPPQPQGQATNSGRQNQPVAVSPFPESSGQGGSGQPSMASNGNAPEMAGNAGSTQAPPPPPAPNNSGSDGNADSVAQPFTLDEPERQNDRQASTSQVSVPANGSPIAEPTSNNRLDREPDYMQALSEQRQAFAALMDMTSKNGQKIEDFRDELEAYQKKTEGDVEGLDKRVQRLESMIQEGSNVNKQRTAQPTESNSSNTQMASGAPKSPADIKALQKTLKEYGYRPGPVDGILGGQTRWAIKRLQEEHGLKKTGWLDKQTLAALNDPKRFSGTYDEPEKAPAKQNRQQVADRNQSRQDQAAKGLGERWYVRGVTPTKAVIYRPDGMSFVARVGTEVPGWGQVTQLDPEKLHVITANGVITKR